MNIKIDRSRDVLQYDKDNNNKFVDIGSGFKFYDTYNIEWENDNTVTNELNRLNIQLPSSVTKEALVDGSMVRNIIAKSQESGVDESEPTAPLDEQSIRARVFDMTFIPVLWADRFYFFPHGKTLSLSIVMNYRDRLPYFYNKTALPMFVGNGYTPQYMSLSDMKLEKDPGLPYKLADGSWDNIMEDKENFTMSDIPYIKANNARIKVFEGKTTTPNFSSETRIIPLFFNTETQRYELPVDEVDLNEAKWLSGSNLNYRSQLLLTPTYTTHTVEGEKPGALVGFYGTDNISEFLDENFKLMRMGSRLDNGVYLYDDLLRAILDESTWNTLHERYSAGNLHLSIKDNVQTYLWAKRDTGEYTDDGIQPQIQYTVSETLPEYHGSGQYLYVIVKNAMDQNQIKDLLKAAGYKGIQRDYRYMDAPGWDLRLFPIEDLHFQEQAIESLYNAVDGGFYCYYAKLDHAYRNGRDIYEVYPNYQLYYSLTKNSPEEVNGERP